MAGSAGQSPDLRKHFEKLTAVVDGLSNSGQSPNMRKRVGKF